MCTDIEIALYKSKVNDAIKNGHIYFDPLNREKTLGFMAEHNLKSEDVIDCVLALEDKDYYKGPDPEYNPRDDDKPGKVMVYVKKFDNIKEIKGIYIYIKLKVCDGANGSCLIWSFHREGDFS